MAADNWFDALGLPVNTSQRVACVDFLAAEGYNAGEAALTVSVVAREVEHDQPDRAIRYMRSFVGRHETVVLRALAVLCAGGNDGAIADLVSILDETSDA